MSSKAKYLLFFCSILCIAFFTACGGRPSYILSEKKMVSLLVDMQLAEAYTNVVSNSSNQEKMDMGRRVLKMHNVSEEQLDSTLSWYGRNVDEYNKLFEKVDEEINRRRKIYMADVELLKLESDNIWPYPEHLVVSEMGDNNSFSFTFPSPSLKKGEILNFSFQMPNSVGIKSTLGVEYSDGTGEAVTGTHSSKNKLEIIFQTDTSKVVSRIFGNMNLRDTKHLPLYIDSIKLVAEPFDTLSYRAKKRAQKSFGKMPQIIKKKVEISASDTLNIVPKDTIPQNHIDSLKVSAHDSIKPVETPVLPANKKHAPEKAEQKRLKPVPVKPKTNTP